MILGNGPNQPGAKSPDEGAQTPVKLALGDIGGITGRFWRGGEVVEV
jgi:carbonyl reductase 1